MKTRWLAVWTMQLLAFERLKNKPLIHWLTDSDLRQHDAPEKSVLAAAVSRVIADCEHEQNRLPNQRYFRRRPLPSGLCLDSVKYKKIS
jgi:hypothetical protein